MSSDPQTPYGNQILDALSADAHKHVARALERIPQALGELAAGFADPRTRERWLGIAGKLILVLGAGLAVEWLVARMLRPARLRLESKANDLLVLRVLFAFGRLLLDVIPIVAFAATATAVMPAVGMYYMTKLVAVTLVNARVISRAVCVVGKAALQPTAPKLRLFAMPDETAAYLYVWLRRVLVIAIYGYFGTEALLLLGLNPGAQAVLQKLAGLAVAILLIVFLLQNRQPVARWLRGRDEEANALRNLRRRLAELWHVLAIVYVLAIYGVWALEVRGGFEFLARATVLTLVVIGAARVVRMALDRLIARGFHLSADLRQAYPGLEARANRYLPGLQRVAGWAVAGIAALLVLQVWGFGILDWLGSETGRQLLSTVFSIAFILAITVAAWEILSAVVERVLRRAGRHEDPKRSARMMTLLPLLRHALRVLMVVLVVLIVLSELGLNIGPLLAGAGVVGLAIGFGAQTLVKDVITGVFILVEDSLSVGDWVDVGGHSGEVESMTIRTLSLRDLSGGLHVVPFSEVTTILNNARDYGYAVIDVGVAYREDTDEVIELLRRVGEEIKQDPEWGVKIVGDLEVFGVNNLGDSSVDVRVRLKTRPLMHWGVRREFLRRTKKLFDEVGVEIPFPHRTLYFGVDKAGEAPPARVALQSPARVQTGGGTEGGGTAIEEPTSTTPDADVSSRPEGD
jgi:small conductance mechanosensitive channel